MLVHVKTPRTDVEITGEGTSKILEILKRECGEIVVTEGTPFESMEWYQEIKKDWSGRDEVYANRMKYGYSQSELGEKTGKTRQYISDIERGKRNITVNMAQALEKVFQRDYRLFL